MQCSSNVDNTDDLTDKPACCNDFLDCNIIIVEVMKAVDDAMINKELTVYLLRYLRTKHLYMSYIICLMCVSKLVEYLLCGLKVL